MNELIFSLNTVLPLILLVALGFFIKRIGILPSEFFGSAEKLVFKIALPCSLFLSVSKADPYQTFSPKLILFVIIGTLAAVTAVGLIAPVFIKKNEERGAFIQGAYRSNFALLGTPLAQRLFPETGGAVASSLMPFFSKRRLMPYLNSGAVYALGSDLHGVDTDAYRDFASLEGKIGKELYSEIMGKAEGLLRGAELL